MCTSTHIHRHTHTPTNKLLPGKAFTVLGNINIYIYICYTYKYTASKTNIFQTEMSCCTWSLCRICKFRFAKTHTHTKAKKYTSRNKLQACCWGLAPGRQHDLPAHETIDAHHRTSAKNDITIHPWHNHFLSCALLTRKIKKVDWVQGKDKMYENGTECKPRIWHAVPIGCTQKRSSRECDVEHFESRFRDLQGKSNK